jgi:hypothetical protein
MGLYVKTLIVLRGRRSHDCMVVGFTITYAICADHHWCGPESCSGWGAQHYVIKFCHQSLDQQDNQMVGFGDMMFNATFNNISVIWWWSIVLVEEIGGSGENHRPAASHWQTLSHNVVHLTLSRIQAHISGDLHRLHTSINKIDHHNITEILLKVALNIITPNQTIWLSCWSRDWWLFTNCCIRTVDKTEIISLQLETLEVLPDCYIG